MKNLKIDYQTWNEEIGEYQEKFEIVSFDKYFQTWNKSEVESLGIDAIVTGVDDEILDTKWTTKVATIAFPHTQQIKNAVRLDSGIKTPSKRKYARVAKFW